MNQGFSVQGFHRFKLGKVRDPAAPFTFILQNILQLFFQGCDCCLNFLCLPSVLHLVAGIFFLGNHPFNEIFVQPGFAVLRVLQPPLIFGDMLGVLLCQCLIDAGLVNAVQQGFQRGYILNVGFQTFLNAIDQLAFFQHHRIGAAVFLARGAVIIVVLLSIYPVGLAGHATAAAAADQNPREQIYRVLFRGGAGVQPPDSLNQIEVLIGYEGFMGIGNANPFRFRLLLQLLDFVVGGALPALNQCASVGFILQNTDDGGG